MLLNPDNVEKLTLKGEHFSDVVCRIVYSAIRKKFEKDNTKEHISEEAVTLIYEKNQDLFSVKGIDNAKEAKAYIFQDYDREESFDWMYSQNIIKEQYKKKKYTEALSKAIEKVNEKGIDTAINTLDMDLKNLDRDNSRESSITNANNFMDKYNERTKEIEELKKSDKPIYYSPSHKLVEKYARMKKGWFNNIISGSGGG